MAPIISVVMPVFNAQKYLAKSIESVLNQTFQDFEFIIINDGSIDNPEKIIRNYDDPRIKYFSQKNIGVGATLSKACNIARGKYIARMDADDICLPNRFECQFEFLENNINCVLVSSAVIYIDENDVEIGRSYPFTCYYALQKKLKYGSSICHPAVMMRRDSYFKASGYDKLFILEDLYLWLRISQYGNLYNLSHPLIKYRILDHSISRSISNNSYLEIINYFNKSLSEFHLSEFDINYINEMFTNAKKESSQSNTTNSKHKLNSNIEYVLLRTLTGIGLRDAAKENIICTLKNIYGALT